jgi:hypothetical protein
MLFNGAPDPETAATTLFAMIPPSTAHTGANSAAPVKSAASCCCALASCGPEAASCCSCCSCCCAAGRSAAVSGRCSWDSSAAHTAGRQRGNSARQWSGDSNILVVEWPLQLGLQRSTHCTVATTGNQAVQAQTKSDVSEHCGLQRVRRRKFSTSNELLHKRRQVGLACKAAPALHVGYLVEFLSVALPGLT